MLRTMLEIDLDLPKPPSLNQYYAGKHWAIRKKQKDEYSKFCKEELEKFDAFTCESYEIHIRYNTRADVDNLVLVSKFTADTLVANEWIADDNPKHYHRLTITYDKSVEKNYCEVEVRLKGATLQE